MVQNLFIVSHNDAEFCVEVEHRWNSRMELLVSGADRRHIEEMEIKVSQYTGRERKTPPRWLVALSGL